MSDVTAEDVNADWSQDESWWVLQSALTFAIADWMLTTIPAALGIDLYDVDDEEDGE